MIFQYDSSITYTNAQAVSIASFPVTRLYSFIGSANSDGSDSFNNYLNLLLVCDYSKETNIDIVPEIAAEKGIQFISDDLFVINDKTINGDNIINHTSSHSIPMIDFFVVKSESRIPETVLDIQIKEDEMKQVQVTVPHGRFFSVKLDLFVKFSNLPDGVEVTEDMLTGIIQKPGVYKCKGFSGTNQYLLTINVPEFDRIK